MTPLERYQSDIASGRFVADEAQKAAVMNTQRLYDILLEENRPTPGWLNRLRTQFFTTDKKTVKGLYFWGGVGRGKTWIVDSFYECLPFEKKMRIHFHRFMRRIHAELKVLDNTENPLALVAEKIAGETRIICFDEFHVSDITDAMLLAGLLEALFAHKVILVATSNTEPEKLYWDGLQRERFLPAIALLKEHTELIKLDTDTDYRLRHLHDAEIYLQGDAQALNGKLQEYFERISPDTGLQDISIEVEDRKISTVQCADGVVWFTFDAICDGPRGVADYIEIARIYQTVLISGIPILDDSSNDRAKRFINLVDEFYDRRVKLIVSASAAAQNLYQGKRLADQFQRTSSRLIEMQTEEYLALQHLSE